jgi:transposase
MSDKKAMWRARVEAWRASGMTAEAFAAEHDFPVGTLRSWSSRLGREQKRPSSPVVRLVRVVPRPASPGPERRHGGIVIELVGVPARVFVEGEVDRQMLATVLDVIRGGAR